MLLKTLFLWTCSSLGSFLSMWDVVDSLGISELGCGIILFSSALLVYISVDFFFL